jgi:cyclase
LRVIDLSSAVDASGWEPDPIVHEIMTPAEGARHMAAEMKEHFGLDFDPADLPGGELLSLDTLTLTSHTGTHVDAPSHYGSVGDYGRPRNIDEMPLDWFLRPAVVLDVSDVGIGVIGVERIEKAIADAGYVPQPLDIVLLHTGASQHAGTPRYFTDFAGLDGPATDHLLDLGVRVIGTDAWSLDAPFGHMIRTFLRPVTVRRCGPRTSPAGAASTARWSGWRSSTPCPPTGSRCPASPSRSRGRERAGPGPWP